MSFDVRRILVGFDGSPESVRTVPWVKAMFPRARVLIAGVIEPAYMMAPYGGPLPVPLASGATNEREARVKRALDRIARRIRPFPRHIVRLGSPAASLIDLAREEGCNLIAIATRGGESIARRVVGGMTEKLLHNARLPLLIVPALLPPPRPHRKIKTIAVPLDGSRVAEGILPFATSLARAQGSSLILVHCLEEVEEAERLFSDLKGPVRPTAGTMRLRKSIDTRIAAIAGWLRGVAEGIRARGVHVRPILRRGRMPQSLLRVVESEHAEVIVMCAHGHGALRHLFTGGLPSRIIAGAKVPVLVIRHDALVQKGTK